MSPHRPPRPSTADIARAAYARWAAGLDDRDALHNWLNAETALRARQNHQDDVAQANDAADIWVALGTLGARMACTPRQSSQQSSEQSSEQSFAAEKQEDAHVIARVDGTDVYVAARASSNAHTFARIAAQRVIAFLVAQSPHDRWLALVQTVDGRPSAALDSQRIHVAYWVVHDVSNTPLVVAAWLDRSRARMYAFVDDYMRPWEGSQAVYGAALQAYAKALGTRIYSFRPHVLPPSRGEQARASDSQADWQRGDLQAHARLR